MATDSSELTFVRCPGCKKLLPALSTKCRICGTSLEASSKSQVQEDESRVLNYPGGAQAKAKSSVGAPANGSNGGSKSVQLDDPLAAYLDELEDEVGQDDDVSNVGAALQSQSHQQSKNLEEFEEEYSEDKVEDLDKLDDLDDFDEELKSLFDDHNEDDNDDYEDFDTAESKIQNPVNPDPFDSDPFAEKASVQVSPPQAEPILKQEVSPKVAASSRVVASSKVAESSRVSDSPRAAAAKTEKRVVSSEVVTASKVSEAYTVASPSEVYPRHSEPEFEEDEREVEQEVQETKPIALKLPSSKGIIQTCHSNVLVGWLVSFSNSVGASIELRSGKFFISSKELKKGDLVINKPSVSTPHAMFQISADLGLQIQDLMSEKGLFIKAKGSKTYKREEDVASLNHGDWIKFGEEEFLVSLLP